MKRIILIFTLLLMILCTTQHSYALDKIKEADRLYKQAIKVSEKKPLDAIKLLTQAIKLTPNNPELYYKRGYFTKDNYQSMQDYDRAIVLNPDKYYDKCYGGDSTNAAYCYDNFMDFYISTKEWDLYQTDTVGKIKSYLSTYKGDLSTKLKNATKIMTAATDGPYETILLKSPDQLARVTFSIETDFNNDISNSNTFIAYMIDSFKKVPIFSNVSDAKEVTLASYKFLYFDFNYKSVDNIEIGRYYLMVSDRFIYEIKVLAPDQQHFDEAIQKVIDTITK